MSWQNFIETNTEIRFGKPCLKGTRIAVEDVLSFLAQEMTIQEIINEYSELTKDHILACLQYSADKEKRYKIAI